MQKSLVTTGCFVGLLTISTVAWADGATDAATKLSQELIDNWGKKNPATPSLLLMLAPLRTPKGDVTAQTFNTSLLNAFTKRKGIRLVDKDSVKAAINEAALDEGGAVDQTLADLAGAFGAQAIVAGSVDPGPGGYFANLRMIDVKTGVVVATASTTFSANENQSSTEAVTLEAQLRRLSDRLAKGLDKVEGEARYQRFAVLPFQEVGQTTQDKQLGLLVSSQLTTSFSRDHNLMIVERAMIGKVMEELSLGQTGLVDEQKAVEVGKLSGAQGLVVGSVSEVGDRYLVNARVVDVQSGQVVTAEDTALPAADLVALSSDAIELRTRSGAVYRSVLLPGWGQFYNREPIKGGAFLLTEIAGAGLAVTFHLLGNKAKSDYDKLDANSPVARFDELRQSSSSNWKRRNIAIYVTAAIHALNILDAFVSGKTFDSATPSSSGSASTLFTF